MSAQVAARVGGSVIDVVVFRIGTRHFGIPIAQVGQVFPVAEIIPLADAPDPIRGLVTIRGTVTPVVDLRRRLDGCWNELRLSQRLILVQAPLRRFALLADDVDGVRHIPADALVDTDTPTGEGFIHTYLCDVDHLLSTSDETRLASALHHA